MSCRHSEVAELAWGVNALLAQAELAESRAGTEGKRGCLYAQERKSDIRC